MNYFRTFISKIQRNENLIFNSVFSGMILFRIWLITGIPKIYFYLPHDDLYFARIADSIIRGDWMGPYTQMTLIKGPFYSFFMVLSFLTGLPLLLNETIFYVAACIVLHFAVSPLIKNRWSRFLLFTFLLFSPASLTMNENLRVWRGFVYFSLTLFVIAFAIGLFLRIDKKIFTIIFWAAGLGLSMGAFMLTREEGGWIYPMLLLFLTGCCVIIRVRKMENPWVRSMIIFSPVIIWYIPILIVSYLNFSHYGFWGYSENLDKDFNRVLNALGRIKTSAWYPYTSITRESLIKGYSVSPLLAELRPAIESSWDVWLFHTDYAIKTMPNWYREEYSIKKAEEIGSGHFLWLFRDAIAANGYYANGRYPREYLSGLADQLESACNSGALECYPDLHIPLSGSMRAAHVPIVFRFFVEDIYELLKSDTDRLSIAPLDTKGLPGYIRDFDYFREFSYNPIEPQYLMETQSNNGLVGGKRDIRLIMLHYKEIIMRGILSVYRAVTLPATVLLCLAWVVLLIFNLIKRKRDYSFQALYIFLFLLGLLISREMVLAIFSATSDGSFISYGTSTYLFTYIILFLMAFYLFDHIKQLISPHHRKIQETKLSTDLT